MLNPVEIKEVISVWVVESLLDRMLIFRLLMYSRSSRSSSLSSPALHLMVSMPRRPSIIWLLRMDACCIVSSLIFL